MARMSEVKITPLAKRLAEENGIDWRQLSGTGPDNTVVERDILAFLAKVMAGEVNLPPTPEDAAPPPEAIPDIAQAQAMLQREGVELGDLVPTAVAAPMPEPTPVPADDFDFDIDLDLDEPILAAEPEAIEPEPLLPPPIPTPPAPEPLRAEPPPLTWEPAETFQPSFTPPPHPELADLPPLPTETDLEPLNPSLSLEPEPSPEPAPPLEAPKLVWETQEVLPPPPAPAPNPLQAGMSFSSAPVESPKPEPIPEPAPEPIFTEPELPPVIAEPEAPPPVIEPEPEAIAAPTPTPAPEAMPEPTPEPAPVPAAPMPATPAMLRVQAWQRLVDIKPVQEAAQVLSEAWQREIGLYPLLFRAVDKALSDSHSQLRPTKGVLSGEELSSYRVTPSQSLRGTLDSLEMAGDASEGLTVLSLLDSAFDQVIFPGTSTLTLGRASGGHALLAVSGELNAEQAGALLERIAYYLERPILLA